MFHPLTLAAGVATAVSLTVGLTSGLALADSPASGQDTAAVHAVFVQTDSAIGNQVVVYDGASSTSRPAVPV